MLYIYLLNREENYSKIIEFCESKIKEDNWQKDQYWILLFEMYKDKKIKNPYTSPKEDANIFEIMKDGDCSFYNLDKIQVYNNDKDENDSYIDDVDEGEVYEFDQY